MLFVGQDRPSVGELALGLCGEHVAPVGSLRMSWDILDALEALLIYYL